MAPETIKPETDATSQINFLGKLIAGLLLILLTTLAILLVIAYWPNKMPPITQGDDAAWYTNTCFNVTLIEKDSCTVKINDSIDIRIKAVAIKIAALKDTLKTKKDSADYKILTDSLQKLKDEKCNTCSETVGAVKRIHLNTILLLLVALMGFLGNMIHIATSFTTFVGSGTFLRSWVLWYFVRPFTAAALAIIIYFIIRAGFLSYGSGASGVSLYGILSLAALAGLFTDNATLKLKEVFDVIFKVKDERTGKLEGDVLEVTTLTPETIAPTGETTIVITGKNLNMPGIKITMDGKPVTAATKTADKLELKFTPAAGATKAVLVIADKAGKELYKKDIVIK